METLVVSHPCCFSPLKVGAVGLFINNILMTYYLESIIPWINKGLRWIYSQYVILFYRMWRLNNKRVSFKAFTSEAQYVIPKQCGEFGCDAQPGTQGVQHIAGLPIVFDAGGAWSSVCHTDHTITSSTLCGKGHLVLSNSLHRIWHLVWSNSKYIWPLATTYHWPDIWCRLIISISGP